MLENWCIERRKKSYFKDKYDGQEIWSEINQNSDIKDSDQNLADFLLEKAWTDGNMSFFDQIFSIVESLKIDSICLF